MMEKYFTINAEKKSIRCKAYYDDWSRPATVILFGHGFGGHMDNKAAERFAKRALEKNKSLLVVCFNWPCHGNDALKKLSLEACDDYLRLILEHVEDTWAPERLLGYATSFGGFLFMRYIAVHGSPFERLALRCPAISMYETLTRSIAGQDAFEKLQKGKPALVGFDRKVEITPGFLEELRAADLTKTDFMDYADDILILHGTKDELVPFDTAAQFADDNCIELIPVEQADHRFQDPHKMDFAINAILRFFTLR